MLDRLRKGRTPPKSRAVTLVDAELGSRREQRSREKSAKETLMLMEDNNAELFVKNEGINGWQSEGRSQIVLGEMKPSNKNQIKYRPKLSPLTPSRVQKPLGQEDTIERLKKMLENLRESEKDLQILSEIRPSKQCSSLGREGAPQHSATKSRLRPLKKKRRSREKQNQENDAEIIRQLMYGIGHSKLQKSVSQGSGNRYRRPQKFTLDKLFK